MFVATLWRRVILDNLFDFPFVRHLILLEQVVSFGLSRTLWVWIVEQVLDT